MNITNTPNSWKDASPSQDTQHEMIKSTTFPTLLDGVLVHDRMSSMKDILGKQVSQLWYLWLMLQGFINKTSIPILIYSTITIAKSKIEMNF